MIQLTNIMLIVEISDSLKMQPIEKLISRILAYDCILSNDIDTYKTHESKVARYVGFYLVKNKPQFVMDKRVLYPALGDIGIIDYVKLMVLDVCLVFQNIEIHSMF